VERLLRDEPDLLPVASVDEEKDLRWNRQKVSSSILQSVLQGESMTDAAKRLQGVVDMDFRSAMRSARTAITGAQNAGRIGSYRRAQDMGIEMRQEWLATLDQRTRHSHRRLDGERVEVGEKFSNGLKYPGDPDGGRGSEIYNCRCTLVPVVEGVDQSDAPRNSKLGGMSYDEWKSYGSRRTKEESTSEHNVANTVEPKYGKFRGLSYVDDGLEKHWGDGSDLDPRRMVMEDTGFDAERAEQVRMDVSSWVGQGYKKIRLEEGEYALTADRLDEFIKVSPKYEGAVWRGIGVERDVADEILNTLRGGGSIDNRGIASWATELDWATEFMSMHSEELDDPVGIIFQLDENRSGASIKHIADIDNDEVIAPRGVEYELAGEIETVVDPYDGEYLLVHVREVI
jgi:SPP1 gp7 family putative phage head morphogenesis protein